MATKKPNKFSSFFYGALFLALLSPPVVAAQLLPGGAEGLNAYVGIEGPDTQYWPNSKWRIYVQNGDDRDAIFMAMIARIPIPANNISVEPEKGGWHVSVNDDPDDGTSTITVWADDGQEIQPYDSAAFTVWAYQTWQQAEGGWCALGIINEGLGNCAPMGVPSW
jgi:hypothetical protein